MNLIEVYVRNKCPDVIEKRELDELTRKMAMKAILIAYGMMVFYMAMVTYNMYFVLMEHKYGYILNLITNITLLFLMRWCVERFKKIRK
jgi:hypothetical protein